MCSVDGVISEFEIAIGCSNYHLPGLVDVKMLKKKLDQSNLFLLLIVLFSIIKQLINDGCRDKTVMTYLLY